MEIIDTLYPDIVIDNLEDYDIKGSGSEGVVYKYGKYAVKEIRHIDAKSDKILKIDSLRRLKDPSYAFPMGFVRNENLLLRGYYMELVRGVNLAKLLDNLQKQFNCHTLDDLKNITLYRKFILDFLAKGSDAIQRAHEFGVMLGDIHLGNVMVNENDEPVFIDTDNFVYGPFGFNLIPLSLRIYKSCFGFDTAFSYIDSDNFIWAIRALQLLIPGFVGAHLRCLNLVIDSMNISSELKDGLRDILLNSQNIPSIGPILECINPDVPICEPEALSKFLHK